MYLLTMGDASVADADIWEARYGLQPQRVVARFIRAGLIAPVPGGAAYTLTATGREQLGDIAPDLWIHEYYLPGVIDFYTARRHFWQPKLAGVPLLERLLDRALSRSAGDGDYVALIQRQRLRLELDTHRDQAAVQTLMCVIAADLQVSSAPADFAYATTLVKVGEYELQCLRDLVSRLNWTLADFELAFAKWLDAQPRKPSVFTNFECMTIVMHELNHNVAALTALYATAGARLATPSVTASSEILTQ